MPGMSLALLAITITIAESLGAFPTKSGKVMAAVTCKARSYDGTFHCSWEAQRQATFRVHVHRLGQEPGDCPSREVSAPRGPVHITLQDCTFCPFAEEPEEPLQVEVEGLGEDGSYENRTVETFLRNIVTPDAPHQLEARREGYMLTVRWSAPTSWSRPPSYFPLRYHLQLQGFDSRITDVWHEKLEETREEEELTGRVRIRCQDPLINSSWSAWSAWSNVQ